MCPMTDFQASEYQKLLSKAREELRDAAQDASLQRNRFTILSLLTRLRQAALRRPVGKFYNRLYYAV